MSKRPYLFVTIVYNDLDNVLPLAWKMASDGHPVRVIFMDKNANLDIRSDARIQHLVRSTGCQVDYYYALKESWIRFPNRPFLKTANPVLVKFLRFFIAFMKRWVWTERWADEVIGKMRPILYVTISEVAEKTIEGAFMRAAKKRGIPVLGVCHALGVYRNVDRSVPMPRPFKTEKRSRAEHALYTRITTTTPYEKALWADEQYKELDKILVMGSARYSDPWAAINRSIYPAFHPKGEDGGKLKILFFMPHWGPHVDQPKTLEAIERIAALEQVSLVIKEHTREGAGNLPLVFKQRFSGKSNIEVIESARSISTKAWIRAGFASRKDFHIIDSTPLVSWCDVCICFSTSIGMEAIVQEKLLVNPVYLYKYASIYDVFGAGVQAASLEELLRSLEDFRKEARIPYATDRIRQAILYGEKGQHDVLRSFEDLMETMGRAQAA